MAVGPCGTPVGPLWGSCEALMRLSEWQAELGGRQLIIDIEIKTDRSQFHLEKPISKH